MSPEVVQPGAERVVASSERGRLFDDDVVSVAAPPPPGGPILGHPVAERTEEPAEALERPGEVRHPHFDVVDALVGAEVRHEPEGGARLVPEGRELSERVGAARQGALAEALATAEAGSGSPVGPEQPPRPSRSTCSSTEEVTCRASAPPRSRTDAVTGAMRRFLD